MSLPVRRRGFTLVELIVSIVVIAILAGVALSAWLAVVRRANENRVVTAAESYARELSALAAERSRHEGQSRSLQDRELVWESLGDLPRGYSVAIEGANGSPVLLQRADGCTVACASGAGIATSMGEIAAAPAWISLARSGASVCVKLTTEGWSEAGSWASASRPNGLGACDDVTLVPVPQQAAVAAWEAVLSGTGAGGGAGVRYQAGGGAGATTVAGSPTTTVPTTTTTTTTTTVPLASWAAVRAGGSGDDYTRELAVLSDGSVIVAGEFQGSVTFGSTTLSSSGSSDVYVGRISTNGSWAWVVKAGGSGADLVGGVELSPTGQIAVTGEYSGSVTFGPTTLTAAGSTDVFVSVLDANGSWVSTTGVGGTGAENGYGVSWGGDGTLTVAGAYSGSVTFGSTTLTAAGGTDAFVAKLSAGTWQWASTGGGTGADFASAVDVDADGSAVVAGQYQNAGTFGSVSFGSNGSREAFVARISSSGVWQWGAKGGGSGADTANAVAILTDGSIVATGTFAAAATFGAYTVSYSGGGADGFVVGLTSSGSWAWAKGVSTSNNDTGRAVVALPGGGAAVTGFYAGSVTLASTLTASGFDAWVAGVSASGTWLWSVSGGEMGLAVAASANGSVLAGGALSGTSSFGAASLTSAGMYDAFVARIVNGAWG